MAPLALAALTLLALTAATLAALARGLSLEVGGPSPPPERLCAAWRAARSARAAAPPGAPGPLSAPVYDGRLLA